MQSANILLQQDWTAKIGDVGLAQAVTRTHLSNHPFG